MKKITSIGEILFDVYGNQKKLGGAPFNFIYHIIKLTGQGNFVSRIGNDESGEKIRRILNEKKISDQFLQTDQTHKTGVAKTNLNNNKVPDFVIKENCAYDFINQTDDLLKVVNDQTDCLYFGTLAQRNETSRKTIQSLFDKRIKYFCDLNIRQKFYSKEIIEKSLYAADVLKLNEDELKLVNKGETLIQKDKVKVTLSGLNPTDFGKTENDFILISNPAGSGKINRTYNYLLSIGLAGGAQSLKSTFRFYAAPTITANGTPVTVTKIKSDGAFSSVMNVYSSPTISARGTLLNTLPFTQGVFIHNLELSRYILEGSNLLITAHPATTNTEHAVSSNWGEV